MKLEILNSAKRWERGEREVRERWERGEREVRGEKWKFSKNVYFSFYVKIRYLLELSLNVCVEIEIYVYL